MSIETNLDQQVEVCEWIDKNLSVKYVFSSEKDRWAFSCFDLVVEHHSSILMLSQSKLYGSAFALLRIEFEALVRGLWLKYVASDNDINRFKRDKVDPKFHELIDSIERIRGAKPGVLSYIKDQQWGVFNSFTHTGIEALLRRIGQDTTGYENYQDSDVIKGLRISGLIAVLAAFELANLSGSDELTNEAAEFAKEYRNEKP